MFLSFIVPVYNAEKYIAECLASLVCQDLSETEYEILCVNDGSRDASPAILQQWQQEHHNIVLLHQGNGGVVSARNFGLSMARGDYIWFVDADDLVRENCLGALKAKAGETGCDRLIVGGYQFTDALTEEEKALSQQGKLPINCPWYDSVVWRGLLKREFLEENRLTFRHPELTHGEDGLYMYEVAACDPTVWETEEVLYFYRVHSGSAETAQSLASQEKKLRSYIRIAAILRDHYASGRRDHATANKLMTFLHFSLYAIAALPAKPARKYLSQMKKQKLYPFTRPAECTLDRSYMTERQDLIGKAFDKLYLNQHRPWGYRLMRIAQQARTLLKKHR